MQLFDMAATPGEPAEANRYAPGQKQSSRMLREREKTIQRGRTTPGKPQANDVPGVRNKKPGPPSPERAHRICEYRQKAVS